MKELDRSKKESNKKQLLMCAEQTNCETADSERESKSLPCLCNYYPVNSYFPLIDGDVEQNG